MHEHSIPKGAIVALTAYGRQRSQKTIAKRRRTIKWDSNPIGPRELATLSNTSSPKVFNWVFWGFSFFFFLWGYGLDSIIAVKKENWVHFRTISRNTSVPQSKSCLSILSHHVRGACLPPCLLDFAYPETARFLSFHFSINVIFPGLQTRTCLPLLLHFS